MITLGFIFFSFPHFLSSPENVFIGFRERGRERERERETLM